MRYERNGKRYEVGDRISVREGTRVKWYQIADFKLNGSILVKYWEPAGAGERSVFRVVQPDTLGLTPIKSV